MISDRLICIAYRERDMVPMLVYRHIDGGDLFARVVPDVSFAEACLRFAIPARAEPKLPWDMRWVHLKSRGTYVNFLQRVRPEADPEQHRLDMLYMCLSSRVCFLRPQDEFMDGRFRCLGMVGAA